MTQRNDDDKRDKDGKMPCGCDSHEEHANLHSELGDALAAELPARVILNVLRGAAARFAVLEYDEDTGATKPGSDTMSAGVRAAFVRGWAAVSVLRCIEKFVLNVDKLPKVTHPEGECALCDQARGMHEMARGLSKYIEFNRTNVNALFDQDSFSKMSMQRVITDPAMAAAHPDEHFMTKDDATAFVAKARAEGAHVDDQTGSVVRHGALRVPRTPLVPGGEA